MYSENENENEKNPRQYEESWRYEGKNKGTKFYGRLRSIRSVLRSSKFFMFKLIEIVIWLVYYTIPFGFS